jgi:hypothetical protein
MAAMRQQLQTTGDLSLGWDAASKADLFSEYDQARKNAARNQARLHAVEDAMASVAIGKPVDTSSTAGDEMEVRTNSDNVITHNHYYQNSFDPIQSPTGNTTPTPVVVSPVVVPPSPRPTPNPPAPAPSPARLDLRWLLGLCGLLLFLIVLLLIYIAPSPFGPRPTPPNINPTPANSGNWKINGHVE